ncbi:MAG: hypothetical protein JWO71_3322 [Candidatus Acidoferrum typicum]|nr:hypothetical protein [Candidatus Acidoferrum typicum]
MNASYVLLLAFGIGIVAGLRSLTAPAVVAWAVRLGWLNLYNSALSFLGSTATVVIFTILALVELVADQLPSTPARTKAVGLIARIVLGGLSGAAVAVAGGQSLSIGGILGAAAGVIGAFAGYQVRTGLVRALKVPDIVIALIEDLVAIGGALLIVTRF